MVTKYTHEEAMEQMLGGGTKDEVIAVFGIPDDKKIEGDYEQWTYYGGVRSVTRSSPSYSTTTASAKPTYDIYGDVVKADANVNTRTYGGSTSYQSYNEYIKILFQDDHVTGWNTRGVDYSVKEPSLGATFAAIVTIAIAIGGTILAASIIP
jgi:hypothetical protein